MSYFKYFFLVFFSFQLYSQHINGGLKIGLNFPQQPKIETENASVANIKTQVEDQSSAYHVGLFAKFAFVGVYFRPEINYSHYKTEYLDQFGTEFYVESNRLDVPFLIGFQPVKMLYFHGGLVAAYYFGDEESLVEIQNSNYDDFKFGFQLGAGLEFGKLSLEGRYEGAFSERHIELIAHNTEYQIETNPSQFLLSLGFKF